MVDTDSSTRVNSRYVDTRTHYGIGRALLLMKRMPSQRLALEGFASSVAEEEWLE